MTSTFWSTSTNLGLCCKNSARWTLEGVGGALWPLFRPEKRSCLATCRTESRWTSSWICWAVAWSSGTLPVTEAAWTPAMVRRVTSRSTPPSATGAPTPRGGSVRNDRLLVQPNHVPRVNAAAVHGGRQPAAAAQAPYRQRHRGAGVPGGEHALRARHNRVALSARLRRRAAGEELLQQNPLQGAQVSHPPCPRHLLPFRFPWRRETTCRSSGRRCPRPVSSRRGKISGTSSSQSSSMRRTRATSPSSLPNWPWVWQPPFVTTFGDSELQERTRGLLLDALHQKLRQRNIEHYGSVLHPELLGSELASEPSAGSAMGGLFSSMKRAIARNRSALSETTSQQQQQEGAKERKWQSFTTPRALKEEVHEVGGGSVGVSRSAWFAGKAVQPAAAPAAGRRRSGRGALVRAAWRWRHAHARLVAPLEPRRQLGGPEQPRAGAREVLLTPPAALPSPSLVLSGQSGCKATQPPATSSAEAPSRQAWTASSSSTILILAWCLHHLFRKLPKCTWFTSRKACPVPKSSKH